ncbi:MAG: hypothetical protein JRG71_15515 [Deltaproteobacteria bacterium]|nr:hypothetical protein [Deltaproteobacteria bacterium]
MNIPETNGSFSYVQVHLTPQQLEPGQTATGRMAAATATENSQLSTDTVTLSEEAKAKAGNMVMSKTGLV